MSKKEWQHKPFSLRRMDILENFRALVCFSFLVKNVKITVENRKLNNYGRDHPLYINNYGRSYKLSCPAIVNCKNVCKHYLWTGLSRRVYQKSDYHSAAGRLQTARLEQVSEKKFNSNNYSKNCI
jgi:hypothetical protein